MHYPRSLQKLIQEFLKLPNVGPKTAERYAFSILARSIDEKKELIDTISQLQSDIKYCSNCLVLSDSDPCSICQDEKRNKELLCIVENVQDLLVFEKTKEFSGRYFVLGKLLNTLEEIDPSQLPIKMLKKLIERDKVKELIIGLNFTIEGESTALYLKNQFPSLKITRLARGLPSGSDLEYADELSLANALKYRNTL